MQQRFPASSTSSRLSLLVLSVVVVSGCQLRKPFEGTVIAAGASPDKVKIGIFRAEDTLPPAVEGGDPVTLRIDTEQASQGRAPFRSATRWSPRSRSSRCRSTTKASATWSSTC